MLPTEPNKPDPYRMCFFDFETQQNKKIIDKNGRIRCVHEPNFAGNIFLYANITRSFHVYLGLYIVCTECIANDRWRQPLSPNNACRICGPHRTISFAPFTYFETKVDYTVVAEDPLDAFVHHLLFNFDRKFKTIAFAHNGGRFDTILIFKNLYNRGICPEMIRRGNKLIDLSIKPTKQITETIFRDSYNLAPFALSKFVKAFGLSIQEKRHFPHYFNEAKHYYLNLPTLPPIEHYRPDSKKPEERDDLLKW
jgi:hypothetical protein